MRRNHRTVHHVRLWSVGVGAAAGGVAAAAMISAVGTPTAHADDGALASADQAALDAYDTVISQGNTEQESVITIQDTFLNDESTFVGDLTTLADGLPAQDMENSQLLSDGQSLVTLTNQVTSAEQDLQTFLKPDLEVPFNGNATPALSAELDIFGQDTGVYLEDLKLYSDTLAVVGGATIDCPGGCGAVEESITGLVFKLPADIISGDFQSTFEWSFESGFADILGVLLGFVPEIPVG